MYLDFYGLREFPFRLTPDPHFYFASRGHDRALAYLTYGLHQGEGFIVVSGEVGAGKTLVVERLLSDIAETTHSISHISSSNLEPDDLLRLVASGFGVPAGEAGKGALLESLRQALLTRRRGGVIPLVVLDEAQNLPRHSLEELRMLSNFKADQGPLLQTLLVGQPQLRQILAEPEMSQVTQRVIVMSHLGPLAANETRAYVEHRLACAGWNGDPKIAEGVFAAVHREGGGMPRRINLLMERLFVLGFLEQRHEFDAGLLNLVLREMREEGLLSLPPGIMREGVGQ